MSRNSKNPRRRDSVTDNALQGAENIVHERLRRALQAASLRKIESHPDLHAFISNLPSDLLRDLGAGVEGVLTVTEATVPNKFLRGLISAAVGAVGGVTEGAADAAETKPEDVDPEQIKSKLLDFISKRFTATPANPDTVGLSPYDWFFVHRTTPGVFHRVRYSGAAKHWNCEDVDHNHGLHQAGLANLPRGARLPDFSGDDNYITQQDMVHRSESPCPKCLPEMHVVGGWMIPEKEQEEPEKPKAFEDTLSKKERWVFGRLCDRAMAEGGLAGQLVQQASEKDVWDKVRLLKDILKEGELNKEPPDKLYQRFVRRIDAVLNPRLKDRLESWLTVAATKISHWISEGNWGAISVAVFAVVVIIAVVIGFVGLLYSSFTFVAAWLFFVDGWYHGRFTEWMLGSVLLTISLILLVPLQWFVDWIGNQSKAVRQLFSKKAEMPVPVTTTPATVTTETTTSTPWIRNLGLSGVFFVLFWGAIGMITVGLAGGIEARAFLVIAAMLSTVAVVGYAQIKKMDIWEKKFLRTIGLVGLIPSFLVVSAVTTTTEWNWQPMQAMKAKGTDSYLVIYPNPFGDPQEYALDEIFGDAATKYQMVWVKEGQVYSKARLVADLPSGIEVRPREDGFGRYTYDLKPNRFPEKLDEVKTRRERAKQLLKVLFPDEKVPENKDLTSVDSTKTAPQVETSSPPIQKTVKSSSPMSKDTGRKTEEVSWLTKEVCQSLPDDVLRTDCLSKL